jgi:galactokinase
MTGGGFGGCTVNLVDENAVDRFGQEIAKHYEAKTGHRPEIYASGAGPGAGRVGELGIRN